jgi:thioredoxin 1
MPGLDTRAYNEDARPADVSEGTSRKVERMASQNLVTLTSQNWQQEVVESDKPVLVDFWAPWCGPCRALTPTIDKLAEQFAGRVKVGKLNTDENQDIAVQYRITSIPQVLVFKGGDQPKERLVGLQLESTLVKMLNRVLES